MRAGGRVEESEGIESFGVSWPSLLSQGLSFRLPPLFIMALTTIPSACLVRIVRKVPVLENVLKGRHRHLPHCNLFSAPPPLFRAIVSPTVCQSSSCHSLVTWNDQPAALEFSFSPGQFNPWDLNLTPRWLWASVSLFSPPPKS